MAHIADIFNAIGERIENWKELDSKDKLILLLKLAAFISTKTSIDSGQKVESIKVS